MHDTVDVPKVLALVVFFTVLPFILLLGAVLMARRRCPRCRGKLTGRTCERCRRFEWN